MNKKERGSVHVNVGKTKTWCWQIECTVPDNSTLYYINRGWPTDPELEREIQYKQEWLSTYSRQIKQILQTFHQCLDCLVCTALPLIGPEQSYKLIKYVLNMWPSISHIVCTPDLAHIQRYKIQSSLSFFLLSNVPLRLQPSLQFTFIKRKNKNLKKHFKTKPNLQGTCANIKIWAIL